jgi:hypothetical protein
MPSCPYLGVKDDPGTCLGYPAEWNLCYRARPSAPVSREHQRELCLSPVYERCPVFQRERLAPLPREMRGARLPSPWLRALLLALLVLAALLIVWAVQERMVPVVPAQAGLGATPTLLVEPACNPVPIAPAPGADSACLAAPRSIPAGKMALYIAPDMAPDLDPAMRPRSPAAV